MLVEGAVVGAYRVQRKLGEGGMGAVFVGEHTLLGRKAAIKVLLPAFSAHQEIVHRFFNEARAVTQIADPGIVQVFDFGYHTDGSAFIIMELLEGEPMDRRLARIGRFPPGDALRLMRLICTSLGAAHAKGVVHRDLKPENIFIVGDPAVTGGERAKILDFGIAKLTSDEPGVLKTRTGMMMGTPVYMSPEQCRGVSAIDPRSDLYSIGCVLMTMLTGRPPFEGEGTGDLIAAHLREIPPSAASRVPGLPEAIDHVLQRCLAKSPGDRYQTMAELAQMLHHAEHLLSQAQSASGSAPPRSQTATQPRGSGSARTTLSGAAGQATGSAPRRRGLIAGIAVTGMVAVAAILVSATRGQITQPPETRAASSSTEKPAAPPSQRAAAAGSTAAEGTATRQAPPIDSGMNAASSNPAMSGPDTLVDAGVAPAVTEIAGDAGQAKTTLPNRDGHRHTSGGSHVRSSGADEATAVDRGD